MSREIREDISIQLGFFVCVVLMSLFFSLGAMLSTAFAAFIAAHLGWRAVFLLSAVVCGLSTIGLIFFLPSSSSVHARLHPGGEDRESRTILRSGRNCLSLPSSSRRKERRQGFSKLDSSSHEELSTDEDEEGDLSHAMQSQESKTWTSVEKGEKRSLRDKKNVIAWQQQGSGDGGGGPEAGGGKGEIEMERGKRRREDDKKIFPSSSSPVSLTHSSSGETHVTDDGDVEEQEEDSRKKISPSLVQGKSACLSSEKREDISSSSSPSVRVYNISSDVSTCKAVKSSVRTSVDEKRRENEREETSSPSFFFDEDDDDLFFSDHRLSSSIQKLQERESVQDSSSSVKDNDRMKQEKQAAAIPPIYTTPTPPTSSSSLVISPPSLFLSTSSHLHQAPDPLKSSSSLSTSSYPAPLSLSSSTSLGDQEGQLVPLHSSSPPSFPCQEQHTPKSEASLSIATSTGTLRHLEEKNKKENLSLYSTSSSSAYMTHDGMIKSEGGGRREKGEGMGSTRGKLRAIAQAMILVWRLPFVLSCSLGYFLIKLIRYSLLFWLPFFLAKEAHLHASTAGYASMIFDIGGIGGAVFGGFLADRVMKGKMTKKKSRNRYRRW